MHTSNSIGLRHVRYCIDDTSVLYYLWLLLCESKVCSSSVSKVYIVHLRIVFLKAALQKRDSVEPMEPPLDPPLCSCAGSRFSKVRHV